MRLRHGIDTLAWSFGGEPLALQWSMMELGIEEGAIFYEEVMPAFRPKLEDFEFRTGEGPRCRGVELLRCGHGIHALCIDRTPLFRDGEISCPVCGTQQARIPATGPRPVATGQSEALGGMAAVSVALSMAVATASREVNSLSRGATLALFPDVFEERRKQHVLQQAQQAQVLARRLQAEARRQQREAQAQETVRVGTEQVNCVEGVGTGADSPQPSPPPSPPSESYGGGTADGGGGTTDGY